jgi:cytoskeleton protein RodZ
MGELGQLLRQTREEKGIDLEKVSHETRIRVRFLEALEQENYDELPTPGHVHGFLRNYALYLGLDLEEVQALYDAENNESRLVPGIFRPKDIDLAPPRRPLVRASVVLGVVLGLVVLVGGGWAFWRYGMPNLQPLLTLLTPAAARTSIAAETADAAGAAAVVQTSEAATLEAATVAARAAATQMPSPTPAGATATPAAPSTETPLPTATLDQPLESPTPTPGPTQTSTPTRTRAPSPTPVEGVTLSIRVVERAWLQVTVDGQDLPGELLEVDDERTWEAEETIHFICGNAGGVEVTVNGEELGTLGGRAEVVERTWTPQGEATPTPAPAPS